MEISLPRDKPETDSIRSVYDAVSEQLSALVPRFGLEAWQPQIQQVYEDLCRQTLAFPLGTRPSGTSRLNQDGTPFQYAVTLGPTPLRSLQFISEAGLPGRAADGLPGAERLRLNRACMQTIARCLDAEEALSGVSSLLDRLAPANAVDLLADPAGAFWTGVAFSPSHAPQIRIYTNASWGSDADRWKRLRLLASSFGVLESWQPIESQLGQEMRPLGTAITIGGKNPPAGRIYLTAYGKHSGYYEDLAGAAGGPGFKAVAHQFARCILGEDYLYPTQTAVCSYGFGPGSGLDFKYELCAHCLFASDYEAEARLQAWFSAAKFDPADYNDLLRVLSEGQLSRSAADLHCYVGVGLKHDAPYSTLFIKPKITSPQAGRASVDEQ